MTIGKESDYSIVRRHYEECLRRHGPTARGMDWPDEGDALRRQAVMLDIIGPAVEDKVRVIDLGCGAGLMMDFVLAQRLERIVEYGGIDISADMIRAARARHPAARFECRDVLVDPLPEKCADYVIMNGVLTEKLTLSYHEMEEFAQRMITHAFAACRRGIAFNVMSSHVDWSRTDLFHWPLDEAAQFLVRTCSRWLTIRMDYGLYEYTVYVYREPSR